LKAFKATVSGKVQGVWFRDSTRQEAIKLKVTGWVKNIPGGMVYLEAEGEEKNLKSLERWLHIGSPHSRVDRVDLQRIVPTNAYSTFKVIF